MLYYVYGRYSPDQYRDEILEWFDNYKDAEEYAEDFSSIPGRYAWVEEK